MYDNTQHDGAVTETQAMTWLGHSQAHQHSVFGQAAAGHNFTWGDISFLEYSEFRTEIYILPLPCSNKG